MAIFFQQKGEQIEVVGSTFPYKDALKAMGGRFQGATKAWILPYNPQTMERVAKICALSGGGRAKDAFSGAPIEQRAAGSVEPRKHASSPQPAASGPAAPKPVTISQAITNPAARASAAEVPTWTIPQLYQHISRTLTQTYQQAIWIEGEVHNLARRSTAIYFDLSEAKAGSDTTSSRSSRMQQQASFGGAGQRVRTLTAKAMLWMQDARSLAQKHGRDVLKTVLSEGMRVRLLVQVSFYQDRGQITLHLRDIDPSTTAGAIALARQELMRELRAKGLDQSNKRLAIPRCPFRVGLITAADSRAFSDFTDQLWSQGFPGTVVFRSARMQGEHTAADVVRAITSLLCEQVDIIVLTRGGGSAADLRFFDDRRLAHCIAETSVPVVAAIGHHDDVSVVEEIACMREKTPTAAAEFILRRFAEAWQVLADAAHRLERATKRHLDAAAEECLHLEQWLKQHAVASLDKRSYQLEQLSSTLSGPAERRILTALGAMERAGQALHHQASATWDRHRYALMQVQRQMLTTAQGQLTTGLHMLDRCRHRLLESAQQGAQSADKRLDGLERALVGLDPRPWMRQGWTQLYSERQSKAVMHAADVSRGDILRAALLDGSLRLEVADVEQGGSNGHNSDHAVNRKLGPKT